jgi:hypothetical protein
MIFFLDDNKLLDVVLKFDVGMISIFVENINGVIISNEFVEHFILNRWKHNLGIYYMSVHPTIT